MRKGGEEEERGARERTRRSHPLSRDAPRSRARALARPRSLAAAHQSDAQAEHGVRLQLLSAGTRLTPPEDLVDEFEGADEDEGGFRARARAERARADAVRADLDARARQARGWGARAPDPDADARDDDQPSDGDSLHFTAAELDSIKADLERLVGGAPHVRPEDQ